MSYDPVEEILDRVRRIETRVTIMGKHVGADVGGGKPRWTGGSIHASTGNVSLTELMKVVPRDWQDEIFVYVNDDHLFTIAPLLK